MEKTKLNELFEKELRIVSLGVDAFYLDMKRQGFSAIHVDWKPVAGGNEKLAKMLSMLK